MAKTAGRRQSTPQRSPKPPKPPGASQANTLDEIFAGVTVFLAMSYIVVANPTILATAGLPTSPVFVATCLTAAIGSIACGLWAKSPTAMAPGMAFNVFVADYVVKRAEVDWAAALIACACAGVVFVLLSWSGVRRILIQSLPGPIKIAINGGIGAILAAAAVGFLKEELARQPAGSYGSVIVYVLFFAGLAIIFGGDIHLKDKAKQRRESGEDGRFLGILASAAPAFSVAVLTLAALSMLEAPDVGITVSVSDLWPWDNISLGDTLSRRDALILIPLGMFVLYMLLADIAGTPYQLLDKNVMGEAKFTRAVDRGFKVDSAMNVLGPVFGTSPVVYYAENNAGKLAKGQGGTVAIVAGLLFLVTLVGVLAFSLAGYQVFRIIPKIAIAPILFYVGLKVIAEYMGEETDATGDNFWRTEISGERYLIPAAVTVVITPLAGLENSLAAGLVAFFLCLPKWDYPAGRIASAGVLLGLGILALAIQYFSK